MLVYKLLPLLVLSIGVYNDNITGLTVPQKQLLPNNQLNVSQHLNRQFKQFNQLNHINHPNQSNPIHQQQRISPSNSSNQSSRLTIIDEIRTIEQLIVDYGYSYNRYYLTTSDGYILSIYRVYNPCLSVNNKPSNLDPIVLGHPLGQDGSIFIDGSPIYNKVNCSTGQLEGPLNKNLAFTLADLGFDVYLPSFRGFRYSRNHTIYNHKKDSAYWDFSCDEMGKFDASTIIDFVINKTDHSDKVIWIGHSFGFAIPLILLSTHPEYSVKFKHLIGLAPAVFLTHTQSPPTRFLADSGLSEEKKYEIGPQPEKTPKERQLLINSHYSKQTIRKLSQQFFYDYGYDPVETNITRLPVFFSQETRTSLSTYVHFAQLAHSEHFKAFDGGRARNLRKYGTNKAPVYRLSAIQNVTLTIMASLGDKAVAFRDVVKLVNTLKVPVSFKSVNYKRLNHYGFLWAFHRDTLVNNPIIEVLNRYTSLAYNVSSTSSHS